KFQRSDIEPFTLGATYGTTEFDDRIGILFKIEYRYHIKKVPLNLGVQIVQAALQDSYSIHIAEPANRVSNMTIITDYNFHRQQKVNPFVGLGFGPYWSEFIHGFPDPYFGVMPRVGVRLFNHINLVLEYNFLRANDSHFRFSAGFYF
ncbi:MAG: hypothetical protein LBR06_01050, partial [Bacteroidales bacterium]|nr:hypothetical protein [Bacteroidales bacterium]